MCFHSNDARLSALNFTKPLIISRNPWLQPVPHRAPGTRSRAAWLHSRPARHDVVAHARQSAMTDHRPARPALLPQRRVHAPLRDAKVSVLDRGFIFGDGVYEVVPVYAGRPSASTSTWRGWTAAWPSCASPIPMTAPAVARAGRPADRGLRRHAGKPPAETNQLVYIQVTRGVAHARPRDAAGHRRPRCSPWSTACTSTRPRSARSGVACVTRRRLPLEEGAHQEHQPARRGAGAADQRRRGRDRDRHVPRRLAERGGRRPTCGW